MMGAIVAGTPLGWCFLPEEAADLTPIIGGTMKGPMKALLVDDHALFREGLALLMAHAFDGVECLQAASIAEALDLGGQHPDLALTLLDLGLPDSDGLAGLRQLQQE